MKFYALGLAALFASLSPASATEPDKSTPRVITISVTPRGFEPTPITVKKDEPLKLVVTRKTKATCAQQLILDEGNISVELPLDKAVEVLFTPTRAGQVKYGCSMRKMISGILVVE